MPESLGGERGFRLPRGVVCDGCNKGVLKQIDEDLNLHPLIRFLRFSFGLGPRFGELQPGVRRNGGVVTFAPDQLAANAKIQMDLIVGGGGTVTLSSSGPSTKTRAEHLPRGLHRMAYNAIAHADGSSRARQEHEHLRSYVLAGDQSPMRAYLLDEKTLNDSLRSKGPWKASYELFREGGKAQVALLRLGMMFSYVSVEPSTRPLEQVRSRFPWLRTAGVVEG